MLLCIVGVFAIYKVINNGKQTEKVSKQDKSIAVLPFADDSPGKDNEYLCNGMMEEILNQLQKIGDLKVKSRTSVEKYRNPDKDIKIIGKELGVTLIMEGSIRKIGDDLRIATQLIDAKTGDHLWSEIYDGKYTTDIFEFQNNVARKVATSLNAVITPQEEKRIDSKPTSEILAYDLCSKGHEMVRKFRYTYDSTYINLALNLYDKALKIDPDYRNALEGKSMTYNEIGNIDSAMVYSKKLISIDKEYSVGYASIGRIYMNLNKTDSALKYMQKAVEINNKDPFGYLIMGQLYSNRQNDFIRALPYFQKAYDLGGDSWSEICDNISWQFMRIGDYGRALKYCMEAFSLRPECSILNRYGIILANNSNYEAALSYLDSTCSVNACEQYCDITRFYIYTTFRKYDLAQKFLDKAIKSGYKSKGNDNIYIGCLLKETYREKESLSILKQGIKQDEEYLKIGKNYEATYFVRVRLTAAYAMLGDKERTLQNLTELEREGLIEFPCSIVTFPGFDNLRNEPEFKAIVKRIRENQDSLRAQVKEMELSGEIDL